MLLLLLQKLWLWLWLWLWLRLLLWWLLITPSPPLGSAAGHHSVHDVLSAAHAPPHFFQKEGSQSATPVCVGDAVLLYSDAHNVMLACDGVKSSA